MEPGLVKNLYDQKYSVAVDLYRQASRAEHIDAINSNSHGENTVEIAVFKLFGETNIAKLALWLDPFWQFIPGVQKHVYKATDGQLFVLTPTIILPTNRTKKFIAIPHASRKDNSVYHWINGAGTELAWDGSNFVMVDAQPDSGTYPALEDLSPPQDTCYGYRLDTSYKTRKGQNSTQGEFELFSPSLESSGGSYARSSVIIQDYNEAVTGANDSVLRKHRVDTEQWSGSFIGAIGAVLPGDSDAFGASERSRSDFHMSDRAAQMYAECLPHHRDFNLTYQIAQTPRNVTAVKSVLEVFRDAQNAIGRTAFGKSLLSVAWWRKGTNLDDMRDYFARLGRPLSAEAKPENAFLSWKYGWNLMYQGLKDLLESPERIVSKVNYLLDRQGQPTSFSSTRSFVDDDVPSVQMWFNKLQWENWEGDWYSTTGRRSVKLRLLLNLTINFPTLDSPLLRTKVVAEHFGAYPDPADIWNLIPWTWLIDWFSNVSSYLGLISEIINDNSLVNFGFMTYRSVSVVTGTTTTTASSTLSTYQDFREVDDGSTTHYRRTLRYSAKFVRRVDLGRILPLKTYAGKGNLSDSQRSTLSALFSQFIERK